MICSRELRLGWRTDTDRKWATALETADRILSALSEARDFAVADLQKMQIGKAHPLNEQQGNGK